MARGPTVTAAEIARLAGVGRAAVSNWRRRHSEFPRPVGGTASSPEFALVDVEDWLQAQGKLRLPVSAEDRLWQDLRALDDGQNFATLVGDVGVFLADVRRRGEAAGTDGIAQPLRATAELAAQRGQAATYELLLARFLATHFRRVTTTPSVVAELLVALAEVEKGTIFDPACGVGTVLLAAARRPDVAVAGQELDDALARIAAARLALTTGQADVRAGDSLRADAFPDLEADAVICHPPFNERNWMSSGGVVDPRWEYGEPPATESDLAWVQHALAHTRRGGRAVVLLPPGTASRRSGRRIRAELLRRGALRAVIALPPGLDRFATLPLHVWVLRRPEADGSAMFRVLLVDATDLAVAAISPDAQPNALVDQVVRIVRAFDSDPEADSAEAHRYRSLPVIDLLDDEVDVTPIRHLALVPGPDPAERYGKTSQALDAMLHRLRELLPDIPAAPGERGDWSVVTIAELARAGAVTTLQASAQLQLVESEAGGWTVLTARDVLSGGEASGRVAESVPGHVEIEPGDVVVAAVSGQVAAQVASMSGALLGPGLLLLRPDQKVLDPHFLAGFLRNPSNLRLAGRTLPGTRFDVRKATVPRLPLADQRRYGRAFARLADFERELRNVTVAGRELVSAGIDGLTTGGLAAPADAGGKAASDGSDGGDLGEREAPGACELPLVGCRPAPR